MIVKPPWLTVAEAEVGVHEIAGPGDAPRIVEYLRTVESLPEGMQNEDETPWCSAFVNWCMEADRLIGTDAANARSWLDWGVALTEPAHGCVAVLYRGQPDGWQGHVGLLVRIDGDRVWLLGGNQGNAVNVTPYSIDRVLGYRWRG